MLERINGWVWGPALLVLVLLVGVCFTVCTGGVQLRRLGLACRLLMGGGAKGKGESPFAVLCTALSAAIGTGNIVGVSTAVSLGGPGALFWMAVSAWLGMAVKYAEGVLAVTYRVADADGPIGGPYYYIERGMGARWRWLGKLFAFFGAAAGLCGIGTVTQSNSIAGAVGEVVSGEAVPLAVAVVVTGLAAMIIGGGLQRVSRVSAVLVPVMLAVYVAALGMILVSHAVAVPRALGMIVREAFSPSAALGGIAGVSVRETVRIGVGRGIFSNEAGMGTEGIAAASSRVQSPVEQGLVCMLSPLVDTVVLCTAAGVVLVVTDAYCQPLEGVAMTAYAWEQGLPCAPVVSRVLLMACLAFFAFSTIVGWSCYAEGCMRYLCDGRRGWMRAYRAAYVAAVFLGPFLSVSSAWTVADILNGCMAFPNLVALLSLGGIVTKQTREYFAKNRAKCE